MPAGQIDVHAESPTRTMHTRMNGGYALLLAILQGAPNANIRILADDEEITSIKRTPRLFFLHTFVTRRHLRFSIFRYFSNL